MKKIFSLIVISMLLSLRLGSFAPEIFTTPVEDALFHKAFIADDNPFAGKQNKAKPNLVFEIPVNPPYINTPGIEQAGQTVSPFASDLIPKDILSKIFIPPEVLF